MSSPCFSDTSGIRMLGRVLDTVGVFDIDTEWHLERQVRFGRVVMLSLQAGSASQDWLGHFEVLHASLAPWKSAHIRAGAFKRSGKEGGITALA